MIVQHRGVPWYAQALTDAHAVDAADAVTEVARGFIAEAHGDPTRVPNPGETTAVQRGKWVAVVSAELVVVGHGVIADEPEAEPEPEPSRGARGPKSYDELIEWLADEGHPVVRSARGHRVVLHQTNGGVLVTLGSGSERRSLLNDVATCRRVLGIPLRRKT